MEAEVQEAEPTPRKKQRNSIIGHTVLTYEGSARSYTSCYEKLQEERGVREARNKTKKVTTYCENCPNKPTLCFNDIHK